MVSRKPEYVGSKLRIECMERANGSCPAGEFLDRLKEQDRKKLDVIFEMLGDMGRIHNDLKFKKVEGRIFEIKSHQIRIFCFFTSGRLILLYGIKKKRDRLPRRHIDKAINMMSEFHKGREHA